MKAIPQQRHESLLTTSVPSHSLMISFKIPTNPLISSTVLYVRKGALNGYSILFWNAERSSQVARRTSRYQQGG